MHLNGGKKYVSLKDIKDRLGDCTLWMWEDA